MRLQDLKHVPDVLTLLDLVLQDLNQGEAHLEEGLAALEQEEVQDLHGGLLRHVIGEDAHEPLEGQDRWVKAQVDEFLIHLLLILLDEAHEHFLVD